MLVVPVALQPVLGSVLLDKVVDAVPEVVGLQQQQLDDEVANLGLVVLVAAHRLQEEVRQSERATPGGGLSFGRSLGRTGAGASSQEQVTAARLRPHLVIETSLGKILGVVFLDQYSEIPLNGQHEDKPSRNQKRCSFLLFFFPDVINSVEPRKFLLTRHKMSRSSVTMLYFQTMSLRISMHLLSCGPPGDIENSYTRKSANVRT